jgi:hypothetical protein
LERIWQDVTSQATQWLSTWQQEIWLTPIEALKPSRAGYWSQSQTERLLKTLFGSYGLSLVFPDMAYFHLTLPIAISQSTPRA